VGVQTPHPSLDEETLPWNPELAKDGIDKGWLDGPATDLHRTCIATHNQKAIFVVQQQWNIIAEYC